MIGFGVWGSGVRGSSFQVRGSGFWGCGFRDFVVSGVSGCGVRCAGFWVSGFVIILDHVDHIRSCRGFGFRV